MRLVPSLVLSLLAVACAARSTRPSEPSAYQHPFEHAEDWTKQFDDPSRDEWQQPERVVAAMRIEAGMTVADVGAGTGYFEPHLSRAAGPRGKVLALDIEPDMVRHLRDRAAREGLANVEAREVDPGDPQLGVASVDRVLIVDTWHHIANRTAYAERLRAALRPGGAVTVIDFKREAPRGPPIEHRILPEEVVRELDGGGLDARIVDVGLVDQYMVVGILR